MWELAHLGTRLRALVIKGWSVRSRGEGETFAWFSNRKGVLNLMKRAVQKLTNHVETVGLTSLKGKVLSQFNQS